MPTGTDMTCGYCGRPIVGQTIWGNMGPYHLECTRGPSTTPQQHYVPLPISDHDLRLRLEALERKVLAIIHNAEAAAAPKLKISIHETYAHDDSKTHAG